MIRFQNYVMKKQLKIPKVLILRVVDNKWTDHIDALDQLRNASWTSVFSLRTTLLLSDIRQKVS